MISPTPACGKNSQAELLSIHAGGHLPRPTREMLISPSLCSAAGDSVQAFEMKFLLNEAQARRLEIDLRSFLIDDPHAESGPHPGQYRITTLYFDTPEFDVYHRQSGYVRRKFRLRRYGDSNDVFLERKAKQGLHVRKRRSPVPLHELDRLQRPEIESDWVGEWFHRRIQLRRLSPVLSLTYDRMALVGVYEGHPMRATFDRAIRSRPALDWQLNPVESGAEILTDHVIFELKYRDFLPDPFKALIHSHQLSPGKASKFRLGLEASQVITRREE
ncbi:polyphosphate polymerase domain-containing protein [Schlesneria paludicola]|uniref:polyphosphate polymerase domain-containing protein n=1 Tax=Schlesneria paludicola TaxID=360056 RepID=UPI00029AF0AF|nr:polyphosphate polymerase domain-containing protein [Schlesneria paludicola]